MKILSGRLVLFVLKIVLRAHSFTYALAGLFAVKASRDGLHPKHRIMNYHKFFVDNIDENDTVLDIGCGNGALTYDVANKAKRLVGIDFNSENISIAKKRYSRENVKYICGNALTDLPKEKFDAIILSNVLKEIAPRFLIRVPMLNRSWIDLYKKELGLEYRLDKSHFIEYTFEGFKEELGKAGLAVLDCIIQFGEIWVVANEISND